MTNTKALSNLTKSKNESKKIIDLLKYGNVKLYYSEECPACQQQIKELGTTFGKIKKLKGAILCNGNCPVEAVPTWITKNGDKVIGSHSSSKLYRKLNTKHKNGYSFGRDRIYSTPQFLGYTEYCSLPGNINIDNVEGVLKKYDTMGPLLGVKFGAGGLLKRPYGPRDNQDLKEIHLGGSKLPPFDLDWMYKKNSMSSYGKRRRSKKVKKTKRSKGKRLGSLKKKKTQFGITTPGTKEWGGLTKSTLGKQWVNPKFEVAKGYNPQSALLYLPIPDSQKYTISPDLSINVPMRYSDNQYNSPVVGSNYGSVPELIKVSSKNNVAYKEPIHMYDNPGGNTMDWLTGRDYYKGNELKKIKETNINPRGYLSNAKTVKEASSKTNGARKLTHNGTNTFGREYYTRNVHASNANTLYQPKPAYMDKKKLSTKFGGKIITLDPKGKITITNPPPK